MNKHQCQKSLNQNRKESANRLSHWKLLGETPVLYFLKGQDRSDSGLLNCVQCLRAAILLQRVAPVWGLHIIHHKPPDTALKPLSFKMLSLNHFEKEGDREHPLVSSQFTAYQSEITRKPGQPHLLLGRLSCPPLPTKQVPNPFCFSFPRIQLPTGTCLVPQEKGKPPKISSIFLKLLDNLKIVFMK